MAERRMISKKIADSDAFMDMALSTQALYFHLLIRADDDGFVGNPKKILRMINANDDDYKLLIAKRFLLTFESGVCVIKHWLIHNYIQNDRYNPSQYVEEKNSIITKENKSYTECTQNVSTLETQVRLGKVRLDKINTKDSFDIFWKLYPRKIGKQGALKKWIVITKNTDPNLILQGLRNQLNSKMFSEDEKYIKHPEVWLNKGCWEDEIKQPRKEIRNYPILPREAELTPEEKQKAEEARKKISEDIKKIKIGNY